MTTSCFSIDFDFSSDNGRLKVRLQADVEILAATRAYRIQNIRLTGRTAPIILPIVMLRKSKEIWVHTDSGRSSDLSIAVGHAIDECM